MSLADIVLNLSYIALLGSTFTRTVNWLRVLLVIGAIFFVIYGSMQGIRSMIVWNIAIGGMHLVRLLRDLAAQRAVELSADEIEVRDAYFPDLRDFDFGVLWAMGTPVSYADEPVIEEGSLPTFVLMVLRGHLAIERNGDVVRGVRRGGLVGEMSFVSGQAADVRVLARGDVTGHLWDQRQLASLEQVNPASSRAFRAHIERDLVAKARA